MAGTLYLVPRASIGSVLPGVESYLAGIPAAALDPSANVCVVAVLEALPGELEAYRIREPARDDAVMLERRAMLAPLLAGPPGRVRTSDLCRCMCVGLRQLERRLKAVDLPPPRHLANWLTLYHGARLLAVRRRAARQLAHRLDMRDPAALHRLVRRYLDCTFTQFRDSHVPATVLDAVIRGGGTGSRRPDAI